MTTPTPGRKLKSVSGQIELDEGLLKLTETGLSNREKVFVGVTIEGDQRTKLALDEVYVTKEERERKTNIKNQTKRVILTKISEMISFMTNEQTKSILSHKLNIVSQRIDSTKKEVILALYEEVEHELKENE